MSTTRTFIAVPAAAEIRQRAARLVRDLRAVADDAKWVAPENMHWTLQFLGEVEVTALAAVCEHVATAAVDVEPFWLEARGAGAFPTVQRPRTIWIGAGEGSAEMQSLQSAVETSLTKLGFHGESRRYVPHLTLGRAGRMRNTRLLAAELDKHGDLEAGAGTVDEVVIYGSELSRDGPTYHVIGRAPLGG